MFKQYCVLFYLWFYLLFLFNAFILTGKNSYLMVDNSYLMIGNSYLTVDNSYLTVDNSYLTVENSLPVVLILLLISWYDKARFHIFTD